MKAKSGKAIEAIVPLQPEEVFEADEAKPGDVAKIKAEQQASKKGKYGKVTVPAHKPAAPLATASGQSESDDEDEDEVVEEKTGWILVKLVDEQGNALAGESYEVLLPDGTVSKGTTGMDGKAKVEGFEPGNCKVTFPKLEKSCVSQS